MTGVHPAEGRSLQERMRGTWKWQNLHMSSSESFLVSKPKGLSRKAAIPLSPPSVQARTQCPGTSGPKTTHALWDLGIQGSSWPNHPPPRSPIQPELFPHQAALYTGLLITKYFLLLGCGLPHRNFHTHSQEDDYWDLCATHPHLAITLNWGRS